MTAEQLQWKIALEEYITETPNDWIAQWLYGGVDLGMWEGTMYEDILKDWYGQSHAYGISPHGQLPPRKTMAPEPAWMSEFVAERGEDIRGPRIGFEEGDYGWRGPPPIYATAPGQATEIRPLGAQADLTTEQLDQLMYYLAYTKGGKPESRKDYLQTMAYKMPGWVQDYISTSQSMQPTKAPPRAQTRPAWQR